MARKKAAEDGEAGEVDFDASIAEAKAAVDKARRDVQSAREFAASPNFVPAEAEESKRLREAQASLASLEAAAREAAKQK